MRAPRIVRRLAARRADDDRPGIAINMEPTDLPWGGGNQFVMLLLRHLRARGHRVAHWLDPHVRAILLVEPRRFETTTFSVADIARFKRSHPSVRCVHRVNECDRRKGTTGVDELLRRANEVADHTIFISLWLRDYFVERWFDPRRSHSVVHNAADPRIFYPSSQPPRVDDVPVRVVTHHWSPHWMKGFAVYELVDRSIAEGELDDFALTVIGRWPTNIHWHAATTHSAVPPVELGAMLRKHHLYLTGSLWEPGGMHHLEGAQCGLPLVYHEDGGGIVELGQRYGVGFRDDVLAALRKAHEQLPSLRERVLASAPSADEMCRAYEEALVG